MSTVIHALWTGEDASPLIMPGSIPLATANVNAELTQYLQDSWKAIIDADVDGPNSEPARIDKEKPLFGQRSLTKRLARTVFFGAAPTIGSARTRASRPSVCSWAPRSPATCPATSTPRSTQLGDRATYFYSGSGKYWYDLQANITRTAKDQAERLHKEDVWAEIVRRLQGQARTRGDFAGVHVCPETNADIPDTDEARLVILHPKVAHKRGAGLSREGVRPEGDRAPRQRQPDQPQHAGLPRRRRGPAGGARHRDPRLPRLDARPGQRGRPRPHPEPEEPGRRSGRRRPTRPSRRGCCRPSPGRWCRRSPTRARRS